MSLSKGKILTAIAAGVPAAMISAGAWSQPVTVNPGDNNVTIPTYTGPVPTFTVLGSTGIQADTVLIGTTPVLISFDEYAVTTSLNPDGVTFAFAIATTNSPTSLSASLPGFTLNAGTLTTSVEGCNPFVAQRHGVRQGDRICLQDHGRRQYLELQHPGHHTDLGTGRRLGLRDQPGRDLHECELVGRPDGDGDR